MESWKVAQGTGQLRKTPVKKVLFKMLKTFSGFMTKPRMSGLPEFSKADVGWQRNSEKEDEN